MRKVKILTDSTCDVLMLDGQDSKELLGIDFIPLYVNLGDKVYHDAVDIQIEDIFTYCESNKTTPKTSAPSVADFTEFFQKYIDQDYDIIYIGIGSKLSSTYQQAMIAKDEFEEGRITVLDSNSLTSAIGLCLIRASALVKEGKTKEEIVSFMTSNIEKNKCSFVIDSLEYLYRGGRCSRVAFAIGSTLRIKPLIALRDGKLVMTSKVLGKKQSINGMINNFKKDYLAGKIMDDYVLVTHTLTSEEYVYIKAELVKIGVPEANIHESIANGVVASHCGRKTIGIIYTEK